jgi:hypothetical protein
MSRLKFWYIETNASWYVIRTHNRTKARQHGTEEFGRGAVRNVRHATDEEVEAYAREKGIKVSDIEVVY